MKRTLMALAAVLFMATAAHAQTPVTPTPTTQLAWDANPAVDAVQSYTLYADNVVNLAKIPATADPRVAFPALTPGQHTLEVTATNQVGESVRSTALVVLVIVTVPGAPTNLRIITARWMPETGWVPTLEFV